MFPLKVSLQELYTGAVKKLQVTKKVLCDGCRGTGSKSKETTRCSTCNGQGIQVRVQQVGPGMIQQMQIVCPACAGQGHVVAEKDRCTTCAGEKVVKQKQALEVSLQPGMRHGQNLVFAGEADQVPNTAPGDLVVVLQQKPHPTFTRDQDHLTMSHTVTLLEALQGFTFPLTHLDGRPLRIHSPSGTVLQPGTVHKISGEGMPTLKNPTLKGDLYVNYHILFPTAAQMTPQVTAMLQQLQTAWRSEAGFDKAGTDEAKLATAADSEIPPEVVYATEVPALPPVGAQSQTREAHTEEEEEASAHGASAGHPGCRPS
jgi:DnaJ family protein A protein 2